MALLLLFTNTCLVVFCFSLLLWGFFFVVFFFLLSVTFTTHITLYNLNSLLP